MDRTGLVTILVGVILLISGIILMGYWLPLLIQVLLGGIGITLAITGIGSIIFGYLMIKG
ncbi:MAG TPA: hypothetical protein O0W88_02250 [Methanocorpusculum sp.]|nr:hypothetical protein [Methanocorpusculum sp.]HJK00724.1 hypothetical protein [Methanocorpusculum sp.]